ncbi:restriction endonuclease [Halorussus amylolyticus]|uniref:restriction endonuclease n=1 Tax=Halorussus amylolyticus TaxID=1126242 RepID=UPI00138F8C7D|nr:restriction endonuclease [Halorussus amylolyticus]
MDQSEFGQFVAALWEQQGWQTTVKRDGEKTFVAVQKPQAGEEGLLWAVPASKGEVGGKQVQQFASLCQQYEVDEAAIVSAGQMSDHAEKVAAGTKIQLLDGEKVQRFLQRRDLTDLVEKYGDGDTAGDGAAGGDESGDSPLDRFAPLRKRVGSLVGSLGTKGLAIAAVLVVAVVAVGFLGGPSIPFLGGGGDGISAESASPDDANATLSVAWNAELKDAIDPNETDNLAYPAPEGQQFVVVRMSINNTGEDRAPLKQAAFKYRANGTTYENETFRDHDGFVDFPMGPGENRVVWTAFAVPEGETGTLFYDQNETAGTTAVEFERDTAISTNVTEQ